MKNISFIRLAILPTVLLAMLVAVLSIFVAPWVALSVALVFLIVQLWLHSYALTYFSAWLAQPSSQNVPSGRGVWADIFARLYALRRSDERNEEQLAEWLARFQNTMRLLPDGVVLMDKSSNLEWCNPVAEKHFQFSIARDKGNRMLNLVRAPNVVDYVKSRVYDTPTKLSYLNRWLELTLIDFEENSLILVSRDITETERVDEMRRDFIANASHELRTPLTVISGFLEHAQDDVFMGDLSREERGQQIALMARQADHMKLLIQDMLTLSRLESDVPVANERVDMAVLIKYEIERARALSNDKHDINIDVAPINLMGSKQEISSVISNLLSNAVRYTPEGSKITLSWQLQNGLPTLHIIDTGLGIAQEHLPRLTERFYRVSKEYSRTTKGTGLGLAIVKHILIRHDADLQITSTQGQGTTARVIFPSHRLLAS